MSKGTCAVCGRTVALYSNGRLYNHTNYGQMAATREFCAGSRTLPKGAEPEQEQR